MKIVWICNVSNEDIRKKITFKMSFFEKIVRLITKKRKTYYDTGKWITNGIKVFENFEDVELHVVSPHTGLKSNQVNFDDNGVRYMFYKPDHESLYYKVLHFLRIYKLPKYNNSRKYVLNYINVVKPDIIHYYGAENPSYSISALDVDITMYPMFVTLQTLMNDPEFKSNYPISEKSYLYRSKIELLILKRTIYIGSEIDKYRKLLKNIISPKTLFFKSFLALSEHPEILNLNKIYDFVYFSASIDKAADIAIESFAIACKQHSHIKLNLIGATPEPFTSELKLRIKELGIENNVIISGKLPTHNDVLKQIQLAKFALVPIKIDLISGTIREAMYCKLPLVSTITPGTPVLNEKRQSVLLSEKDDFEAIAKNMLLLVDNPVFAQNLAENAFLTVNEMWNNKEIMRELKVAYRAIIQHHKYGVDINKNIAIKNNEIIE